LLSSIPTSHISYIDTQDTRITSVLLKERFKYDCQKQRNELNTLFMWSLKTKKINILQTWKPSPCSYITEYFLACDARFIHCRTFSFMHKGGYSTVFPPITNPSLIILFLSKVPLHNTEQKLSYNLIYNLSVVPNCICFLHKIKFTIGRFY